MIPKEEYSRSRLTSYESVQEQADKGKGKEVEVNNRIGSRVRGRDRNRIRSRNKGRNKSRSRNRGNTNTGGSTGNTEIINQIGFYCQIDNNKIAFNIKSTGIGILGKNYPKEDKYSGEDTDI